MHVNYTCLILAAVPFLFAVALLAQGPTENLVSALLFVISAIFLTTSFVLPYLSSLESALNRILTTLTEEVRSELSQTRNALDRISKSLPPPPPATDALPEETSEIPPDDELLQERR